MFFRVPACSSPVCFLFAKRETVFFRVPACPSPVCFLLAKRESGFFRFRVSPSPVCFDLLANRESVFRGRKRRSLSLGRRGDGEQENQQHYCLQAPQSYLRVNRGDFQAGRVKPLRLMQGCFILPGFPQYLVPCVTRWERFGDVAKALHFADKTIFERLGLFETATLGDHALLLFVREGGSAIGDLITDNCRRTWRRRETANAF